MKIEHKSYLAEKIILHFALSFITFSTHSVLVVSVYLIMWLMHYGVEIPSLLGKISIDMLVMPPVSSLCTNFFIIKSVVMYDRGIIKNRFLYFIKMFLAYYICLTIFIGLKILIIDQINAYDKLTDLAKIFLYYGTNYIAVLIFIILFYLNNKEYFKIQNMLIE